MVATILAWAAVVSVLAGLTWSLRRSPAGTALLVVSVVVSVAAAEGALRLAYPSWRTTLKRPSRDYHHMNLPNTTLYDGRVEGRDIVVQTNEDGLRSRYGREEFQRYTERLVVMGDSFTFGSGVDQDAAVPQALERILRQDRGDRTAVLNAGTVSHSPLLASRLFDGVIRHYRPTKVLYLLDATDFGDDYNYERELVGDPPGHFDWSGVETPTYYGAVGQLINLEGLLAALTRPFPAVRPAVGLPPASARTYNYYAFEARIGGRLENNRFFVFRYPMEQTRQFLDRTFGYLQTLAHSVQLLGGEFLLVVTPRFQHWNPAECPENWEMDYAREEPYQFEYFRYFNDRRADAGFEIFDLLPAFRATREYPLVFKDDPHWNAAGHAFVARTLADYLRKSPTALPTR
jgi:hypothetical protein